MHLLSEDLFFLHCCSVCNCISSSSNEDYYEYVEDDQAEAQLDENKEKITVEDDIDSISEKKMGEAIKKYKKIRYGIDEDDETETDLGIKNDTQITKNNNTSTNIRLGHCGLLGFIHWALYARTQGAVKKWRW